MPEPAQRRYSFYYRTKRRTSTAQVGTVFAVNSQEAMSAASQAVREQFPEGKVFYVVRSEKSRLPVKNDSGELVCSSQLVS